MKKAKETPSNIPPGIALLSPITTTAGVLNSPDVQMLSLNSPQIEKFLLTGSLPTPKGTSPMLFPSNSTNLDKQKFEKGFNDALAKAHAANAPGQAPLMMGYIPAGGVIIGNRANMNPNSLAFNNPNTTIPSSQPQLVVFNGFHNSMPQQQQQTQHQQQQQHQPQQINRIKSENDGPVRAESTHSTASSTNMGSDDYHTQSGENTMDGDDKIEKKRLRNRIAAQKCRQRKLQRISELEVKVHELNVENKKLEDEGSLLRNQLNELKHTLDQHSKAGCVLD